MSMTKSQEWYLENVIEDKDDIDTIAMLSKKALFDKLSIDINNPEMSIGIYAAVFSTIIKVLKEQQKNNTEFSINIAKRLEVGFTSIDDENAEKNGNFMVYIRHTETPQSTTVVDEDEDNTIVLATQWNAANITEQANILKEIATKAIDEIYNKINLRLGSIELVIPMFCIIHEQIIGYMKIKRVELDKAEHEINMVGLFDVKVEETDEGDEKICFTPSVDLKLALKDDEKATDEE